KVYLHPLICDEKGQKMSKSKGNVIDPLVMIDKFGTDALRFTLAVTAAQGRDIKLSEDRIEGYRNFCNKLWNLARFTLMNLEEGNATGYLEVSEIPKDKLQPADKWIITKFEECRAEVESAIEKYEFDRAARAIYSFTWHQLCDWYVELIKPDLWGNNGEERKINSVSVLASTLRDLLKITHPFMPFITEEINSSLSKTGKSILEEDFPKTKEGYPKEAAEMEAVMEVIRTIRNIRTEVNVKPKALVECVFLVKDTSTVELIKNGEGLIKTLAKVSVMEVAVGGAKPEKSAFGVAGGDIEVFVALKGVVDTESETKRLSKSLEKTLAEAEGIEKKLSNKNFTGKAPKEVVEEQRAKLIILTDKKEKIEAGLERLKDLS
ncbi:MAG: class I tRNA ligase family protein, partial [Deltaproteobacteria bacterium]|nr:class I tRNA ligase family protein [Deltaproteobacteria bacterium]